MTQVLFILAMVALAASITTAIARFLSSKDTDHRLPGVLFLGYVVLFAAWLVTS